MSTETRKPEPEGSGGCLIALVLFLLWAVILATSGWMFWSAYAPRR